MFPSSEIRILERSSDRLVVLDPPFAAAGLVILIIVAVGLSLPFAFRSYPRWNVLFGATLASALPIAVFGLAMLTSSATITFDSNANQVVIRRNLLGISWTTFGPPLNEIIEAEVTEGAGSKRNLHSLCLIVRSGENIRLGNYTSQKGHRDAAKAINNFLAARSRRTI